MKRALLLILALIGLCLSASAQLDTSKWAPINNQPQTGGYCTDPAQITELGGYMVETTIYSTGICPGASGNYQAGSVISNPFYFTYGTVKVRAKLSGFGVHSTIWMWGGAVGTGSYPPSCLPAMIASGLGLRDCITATPSYELDITELLPNTYGLNTVNDAVHTWTTGCGSFCGTTPFVNTYNAGSDLSASFHIYEIDWTPTTLTWKIDGTVTNTFTYALTVPMFLLLDQEIDTYAPPSASGFYPLSSQFDWVHVYCTADTTYPAGCTPGAAIFDDEFNNGTGSANTQGKMTGVVVQ